MLRIPERRAVHARRLARQQLLDRGDSQHELKRLSEEFPRQPIAGVGLCRVVGRGFLARQAQESPQAQAAGTRPGDARLAIDAFEVTHPQHANVDARRNRWLATHLPGGVVPLAAAFEPAIELCLGQQFVELPIEGMPGCLGNRSATTNRAT
jgi:hypothetical protein